MEDKALLLTDIMDGVRTAYLWCEPEVIDFTIHATGKVCIQTAKGRVDLELQRETAWKVLGLLSATVFSKDYTDTLLTWNLKSLLSYFRFYGSKWIVPTSGIVDLHIIENFHNLNKRRPENLSEAINRLKVVSVDKGWVPLYKAIHKPLMLKVLPALETTAILNQQTKTPQFPYYEIEGQSHGRMNCLKKYKYGYLPINMGKDLKQVLIPKGYGITFLAADYRSCEVGVLQWLSKDEKLKQIIESGADLHSSIFQIVTEGSCDTEEKREKSKRMFLPVMYGCGPEELARNLSISAGLGKELCRRIHYHFKTASEWMASIQKQAEKLGSIRDHFGRLRHFAPEKVYLARNFVVQAAAATFCQEKLIDLFNALENTSTRLCFVVHDGYGMTCPIKEAPVAFKIVKQALESESRLCPGLKVGVKIKFGSHLHPMKEVGGVK
jgi:hypothetical protein